MFADAPPLVSDATAWLVLASSCAAVVGLVFATCWKVVRWIDRQESRYEAVDIVVADWHDRGLTPRGAVNEAAKYRQLADVHTSAISSIAGRLDDVDERFGHVDRQLEMFSARVDDIAVAVRKHGT